MRAPPLLAALVALAALAMALLPAHPARGRISSRIAGTSATSPSRGAAGEAGAAARAAPRSRIHDWPIPFGPKRKRQMAAYSERHYGERTWRLRNPRVIVEHVAVAGTAAAVHDTFAPDHPDPELHELPNVCSHFVVNSAGRIFRLVNVRTRCRHTVGLNWTAIGIEHTGYSDGDVLGDRRQMRASLRLTQYLRCRFGIGVRNVIGHNESLSSPFHRELVPSLRDQTHSDWRHASMQVYRRRLRRLGHC
jgi:N-acetylmuramoyl-L-alanine amidase